VEQLEARTVLSNFKAAMVSDLIADINAANQAGGSNTITLVAPTTSPYDLTAVDNTTDGLTGLPVIAANDNLTIVGNGDAIARSTAPGTPAFRLLDVAGGASLTLQNLTLEGGLAFGSGVLAEGGAVFNQGTLHLNGVTVQNNIARGQIGFGVSAAGGGIFSSGSLTLEGGTTVQNNQALGGIGFHAVAPNRGGPGRPGLAGGSGYGGGVYMAAGTVTLTSASLAANTAQGGQGGAGFKAYNGSDGYIYFSGGHGGNGYGGGLYVAAGAVTLASASMFANTAQGGQGGVGGGLGGNGGNGLGGGLYVSGGAVVLLNDTATKNSARNGPGEPGGNHYPAGQAGEGEGGGLYIVPAPVVYLDTFTQGHVTKNTASSSDPNTHGPWRHI
jgi:hypothetical protein